MSNITIGNILALEFLVSCLIGLRFIQWHINDEIRKYDTWQETLWDTIKGFMFAEGILHGFVFLIIIIMKITLWLWVL